MLKKRHATLFLFSLKKLIIINCECINNSLSILMTFSYNMMRCLSIIKNSISHQKRNNKFRNVISQIIQLHSSVPQDSHLGAILFTLFIKNLSCMLMTIYRRTVPFWNFSRTCHFLDTIEYTVLNELDFKFEQIVLQYNNESSQTGFTLSNKRRNFCVQFFVCW